LLHQIVWSFCINSLLITQLKNLLQTLSQSNVNVDGLQTVAKSQKDNH
jgi:hypothetical protein